MCKIENLCDDLKRRQSILTVTATTTTATTTTGVAAAVAVATTVLNDGSGPRIMCSRKRIREGGVHWTVRNS